MKRILLQGLIVSCLCLPVIGQASDGENSAVDPRMQAHKEYMAARRAAQQASGKQATIEMLSKGNQSYCIYTDPLEQVIKKLLLRRLLAGYHG